MACHLPGDRPLDHRVKDYFDKTGRLPDDLSLEDIEELVDAFPDNEPIVAALSKLLISMS
jgi:hypothetical protein